MTIAASFLVLLFLAVPVALVLAMVSLTYIGYSDNWVLLASYPQQMYGGLENYGLMALPLFILVGELMGETGIARRLMTMAAAMMGQVRGGLAYVNLLANMMMASILGSTVAQITVMTRMAVPEMERAGYKREHAVALTAAGGLLAPIIPPSMLFVIFGVIAQISIGKLFIAGILPGLLLSLCFFALLGWMARRHGFPQKEAQSLTEKRSAILQGGYASIIPLTIVGTILLGLATPTEAAALACIASIVIGRFVYREFQWQDLWPAVLRTARSSSIVLLLIACAQLFSWVITFENLPAQTAQWMQTVATSPEAFLLLVLGLLLLVGMVLDPIPALILVVPVLLPVAQDIYSIDPFHFGVVVCLTLVLGLLTPPVGSALFAASALSGIRSERLAWLLLPYLLAMLALLLAMVFIPGIATLLI